VQLSNCYKVEQMRKARGWVKTNKKDADLISLLSFEQSDWWKVWRAIFDRVTKGGKKDRNRGYIKVARELVKVVYAVWSKGVDYQTVPPARPGRNKNKKNSRSETGQLLHPMVHASMA
jgi:hypothetical protein